MAQPVHCSVCKSTHPINLGAPADCVGALSARIAALENTEAMLDRLYAAAEARDRAAAAARQPAQQPPAAKAAAEAPTAPPASTAG